MISFSSQGKVAGIGATFPVHDTRGNKSWVLGDGVRKTMSKSFVVFSITASASHWSSMSICFLPSLPFAQPKIHNRTSAGWVAGYRVHILYT